MSDQQCNRCDELEMRLNAAVNAAKLLRKHLLVCGQIGTDGISWCCYSCGSEGDNYDTHDEEHKPKCPIGSTFWLNGV